MQEQTKHVTRQKAQTSLMIIIMKLADVVIRENHRTELCTYSVYYCCVRKNKQNMSQDKRLIPHQVKAFRPH